MLLKVGNEDKSHENSSLNRPSTGSAKNPQNLMVPIQLKDAMKQFTGRLRNNFLITKVVKEVMTVNFTYIQKIRQRMFKNKKYLMSLAIATGINNIRWSMNLIALEAKKRELKQKRQNVFKSGSEACWNSKAQLKAIQVKTAVLKVNKHRKQMLNMLADSDGEDNRDSEVSFGFKNDRKGCISKPSVWNKLQQKRTMLPTLENHDDVELVVVGGRPQEEKVAELWRRKSDERLELSDIDKTSLTKLSLKSPDEESSDEDDSEISSKNHRCGKVQQLGKGIVKESIDLDDSITDLKGYLNAFDREPGAQKHLDVKHAKAAMDF